MALLLYLWRRRLHSKILPNELSSWRCHFAVPTASSSNLLNGLPYPHHCDIAGLVARVMPLCLSSRLFSCFVVTGTDHADLLTAIEITAIETSQDDSFARVLFSRKAVLQIIMEIVEIEKPQVAKSV